MESIFPMLQRFFVFFLMCMIFITSLLSSSLPLSLLFSPSLSVVSSLSPFSVVGISRDVVDGKGSCTARLRLRRRVGGIYRDVVDGKRACTPRFRLGRKSGRLFIEMSSMESLIAMSSKRRKVQTTTRPASPQTKTSSRPMKC